MSFLTTTLSFTAFMILSIFGQVSAYRDSAFGTLKTVQNGGVLSVAIHNNSTNINLYDSKVQSDLYDLVTMLQGNTSVKVVVFTSTVPDFFLAHLELNPNCKSVILR